MRTPDSTSACWVDGHRSTVSEVRLRIDDPTVLAGLGLFETIAVRTGRPLELDRHLRRLANGAGRLGLNCPEAATLHGYATRACEELAFEVGWLKLILTGRGKCVVFGGSISGDEEPQPASAILLPWRRNPRDPLTGLKTLNYSPNVIGLATARSRGADEGIWLNTRGHLAEGCSTNLFVVQGRKLFTPGERDGILPGIMREIVLLAGRRRGLAVHCGKVRLRRLEQAAEAFLTSSLRGVHPLVSFEGRPVGTGRPGPITVALAAEVERLRGLDEEKAAEFARLEKSDRGAAPGRRS